MIVEMSRILQIAVGMALGVLIGVAIVLAFYYWPDVWRITCNTLFRVRARYQRKGS